MRLSWLQCVCSLETNHASILFSSSQALAQCDGYLRGLGVIKEAVDDTAGAAQLVSRQVSSTTCELL